MLSLVKEKKSYSSWEPIQSCFGDYSQQSSESQSIGHQRKSLPQFIGFILLLCFMLQGPASWFSSSESKNSVRDFFFYKPVSAQQLALQPTELQETKATCATILHQEHSSYYMGARYYDPVEGRFISADPLGHGASMGLYDYCNGDPVNGLDPDGRCKLGLNDGVAGNYNPSSAKNQTVYNAAWGLSTADSYLYNKFLRRDAESLMGIGQLVNWGMDNAEEAAHVPQGTITATAFMFGPEIGGAVAGLRVWGALRAGAAIGEAGVAATKAISDDAFVRFDPAYQDAIECMLEDSDPKIRKYAVTLCLGFFVFRTV